NPEPILNDGIIYSLDSGKTWLEWNEGLGRNFAIYYCVNFTDSISYIGTNKGLYKSFGFGKKWEPITAPTNSQFVSNILIDKNEIYLSSYIGEIYYSED